MRIVVAPLSAVNERQAKVTASLPGQGDIAAALNEPRALRRFLQASNDRELALEAVVVAQAPEWPRWSA